MEIIIIAFAYLAAVGIVSLFILVTICYFFNCAHGGKKNFFEYLVWYIKKF